MQRTMLSSMATLFVGMTCAMAAGTTPTRSPCTAQESQKPTAQERIVQRDIQEAIDSGIEEWEAKDLEALSRRMPPDFTVLLLDGTTLKREQVLEGMQQDLASSLRIDVDRTYTRIDGLVLMGNETTVCTQQQYVRTLPDRKNGSPHEVITSVRHQEKWVFTKDGWVATRVEEIEQGPTYLDGEPYNPR